MVCGKAGQETYLIPLTDMLFATFLEEALVMRDAVLAVDEAVRVVKLAMLFQSKIEECIRRPLRLGGGNLRAVQRGREGVEKRELIAYPAIVFVVRRDCSD